MRPGRPPEPAAGWTEAQRKLLGLPLRQDLEDAQRAAWRCALQAPRVDVLWHASDDTGEATLASPLVQALALEGLGTPGADTRDAREERAVPVLPPVVEAGALVPSKLSASSYEDLRRCPYRFFAMRMLGLKEAEEIEAEVDKRDFGTWLTACQGLQRNAAGARDATTHGERPPARGLAGTA